MNLFLFGKKRRVSKKKKSVKRPPKRLLRLCKKYGIKTTIKRGKKRVYKKVSVLKKLIKMKRKKVVKKSKRKSPRRKMTRRRMYFGESNLKNMVTIRKLFRLHQHYLKIYPPSTTNPI